MEWAAEADDELMMSWSLFRLSQQAVTYGDPARALSLVETAGRRADRLPATMRAAIAQQAAAAYALDGDETACHAALDAAEDWAAPDTNGDARTGHGSFCTPAFLQAQRATCWLRLGKPRRAITAFERALPDLPKVYRRDRGLALARLAAAHVANDDPDAAATTANEALGIATATGSSRIAQEVTQIGRALARAPTTDSAAEFLHALDTAGAGDG
jgi:tetratricopeptide (TPR) repeat protein